MSEALAAFVATLRLADDDPKAVTAAVAVRLAARIDEAGPAPTLVRELRGIVADLAAEPGRPGGLLDELRARRYARRVDYMLGGSQ